MDKNIQGILIIVAILVSLDLIIISILITRKRILKKDRVKDEEYKNILTKAILDNKFTRKKKIPIAYYIKIIQTIRLDKVQRERAKKVTDIEKAEKKYFKNMDSVSKTRRIEAITYLGILKTKSARLTLEKNIIKEKDMTIKLYMAIALSEIGNKESISALTASLHNTKLFYRVRVNALIVEFGEDFNSFLPKIIKTSKPEVKELIVDFASVYISEEVKGFLINLIDNKEMDLRKIQRKYELLSGRKKFISSKTEEEMYLRTVDKACDILEKYYSNVLNSEKYLNSEDINIKNKAIGALSNLNSRENIKKTLLFLRHEDTSISAVRTISKIIERNPDFIDIIVDSFHKEKDIKVKGKLARILSNRMEYFIMNLSGNKRSSNGIIKEVLQLGRTSEVIDFLNNNKDKNIEKELVIIIKEVAKESKELSIEFSRYLNESILKECGITPFEEAKHIKNEEKDKKLIINIYIIALISISIYPAIYLLKYNGQFHYFSMYGHLKNYVVDFNYFIAYYSITIGTIYLVLLILSYLNAKMQVRLWNVKSSSLLFKRKMLPAVSIIAPAYNEEKTIIDSANSLLNLKYPDYELVIVNDGSSDNTLELLISYFNLKRVNYNFDYRIKTKSVRGVYMNPSRPKLIVVDKYNGGKADSLNAGINISSKEYICGIDADSVLEDEALLKLASLTLDSRVEIPALGGNVFPINGCIVEHGYIKEKHIPNSKLGRFQTIEYIRAFMAGRLGWSYINSLLLISGAFGLFRKERVISVGGYLTSSGKFEKDTIGEDMELVVRIIRFMKEKGINHRIRYAFNANCWTEVPEDMKTLKKQRYRWHKGLIDILNFHKKMIVNPMYGRTGIIAMSYYFIFEVIGPLIESQGIIMLIVAMVMGLLNVEIALLLFLGTILIGVLTSIASLIIAEINEEYFTRREMLIMIGYSIIENFGPRQLFSMWRVGGFFSMLKKPVGWEKADRKGFASSEAIKKN